jgi:hypothetical protein
MCDVGCDHRSLGPSPSGGSCTARREQSQSADVASDSVARSGFAASPTRQRRLVTLGQRINLVQTSSQRRAEAWRCETSKPTSDVNPGQNRKVSDDATEDPRCPEACGFRCDADIPDRSCSRLTSQQAGTLRHGRSLVAVCRAGEPHRKDTMGRSHRTSRIPSERVMTSC